MKIVFYVLEWIISFFVIWFLYFCSYFLLQKKFNKVTSVIFSFAIIGLLCFITAPYVLTFPKPSAIYLPYLIFWFIMYFMKSMDDASHRKEK